MYKKECTTSVEEFLKEYNFNREGLTEKIPDSDQNGYGNFLLGLY